MTTPKEILWTPTRIAALATVLILWFAAAVVIGTGEVLANHDGSFLAPIAVSAVVPVALFLALFRLVPGFRRFVLAQDIETLTTFQHWRVVGFAFLLLYAHGVLPAGFAFPAGVGDVAIGLAAPVILARLRRDPGYAQTAAFRRYHYLGLLDFAVAVTAAGLTAGAFPVLHPEGPTSAPMDVWPLNLFPSFIVPAFIILHLTVLLKLHAERPAAQPRPAALETA